MNLKHKKVLFVLNSSHDKEGSVLSFTHMLEGLLQEGITAYVIVPYWSELCEGFVKKGVECHAFNFRLSTYPPLKKKGFFRYLSFSKYLLYTLVRNALAFFRVCYIVKKNKIDLIHTNVGPLQFGFYAARFLRIPHIWHLREYGDLDFNLKPLFSKQGFIKRLHARNNYSIAITKDLFSYFSLMPEQATVIYNGILSKDKVFFTPHKDKYFLFVGRLEENKGIRILLQVYAKFVEAGHTDYPLWIAGEAMNPTYNQQLLDFVKKERIETHVRFLGNRNDVCELMAKANALIVPSLYEGFGRITAEALFNGCLVIGYNAAGTKEILHKKGLGLLYSTPEELLQQLIKVKDKGIESFFPLLKTAQKEAVQLYSNEQNIKQILSWYQYVFQHFLCSQNHSTN